MRCVASNYFAAAATIAADAAAATVAYVGPKYQKHSGSNKRHVFIKNIYTQYKTQCRPQNHSRYNIVFSTSHAYDIAQSRDSNTVQRYSPRSNSVSLHVSSLPFRRRGSTGG